MLEREVDTRELKALEIAARTRITFDGDAWVVPSQSGNPPYRVVLTANDARCPCDDFQLRQKPCKHILAVRLTLERECGGRAPAIDTDTPPKKPVYDRNWPAINLSSTTEKHRFQVLLSELCAGAPEISTAKWGRKPHKTRDALFAIVYKVYSTFSGRRFHCDLQDAHANGYTVNSVPGMKVSPFMGNDALTPILQMMIVESSKPLKAIEKNFAPDASGFSTSRFIRWLDIKANCYRSSHDWVKVHLMVGCDYGIICAADIRERDTNDSPIMPSLLTTTAETFEVLKVMADKGYSSVENIEAVHAAGATPYIPFKVTATGGGGGLWEKAFHYFSLHREEFLRSYHQRSNIESVFSSIKRKSGDGLRSRTDTAMKNEAYAKLVCHNICRLIYVQCELGLEPVFWGAEPVTHEATLLSFPSRQNA